MDSVPFSFAHRPTKSFSLIKLESGLYPARGFICLVPRGKVRLGRDGPLHFQNIEDAVILLVFKLDSLFDHNKARYDVQKPCTFHCYCFTAFDIVDASSAPA